MILRPLSGVFAVDPGGESVDVNSVDEVPDSAWFTNRLGTHPLTIDELMLGACDRSLLLNPEAAAEGTWVVDSGKETARPQDSA